MATRKETNKDVQRATQQTLKIEQHETHKNRGWTQVLRKGGNVI